MADNLVLDVQNLVKHFPVRRGFSLSGKKAVVHAVDDISFSISQSCTLGIVGESGSGKTTLGRCVVMLSKPTSGHVNIMGQDVTQISPKKLRKARANFNIVFQDPISSLDPRMKVYDSIAEPLVALGYSKDKVRELVLEMCEQVSISKDLLARFPHEFSGGQRQRIGIARALVSKPRLVVLDEPTSSLDVSVQAQILNLLLDIQEGQKLSYLFITHNINVVRYMSDRAIVMYLGEFVEEAPTEELIKKPLHPYTKLLIKSVPSYEKRSIFKGSSPDLGEVPSAINPPSGCRFHPRCHNAREECKLEPSKLEEVEPGHFVACQVLI